MLEAKETTTLRWIRHFTLKIFQQKIGWNRRSNKGCNAKILFSCFYCNTDGLAVFPHWEELSWAFWTSIIKASSHLCKRQIRKRLSTTDLRSILNSSASQEFSHTHWSLVLYTVWQRENIWSAACSCSCSSLSRTPKVFSFQAHWSLSPPVYLVCLKHINALVCHVQDFEDR